MQLSGKVALLTGGAQGLGKAFSEELLKNGTKVCFCDVNKNQGEATLKEFQIKYGQDKVIFIKCDVTDHDSFEAVFKKTLQTFGGVDIVVNNAGVLREGPNWRTAISVNLIGVIEGSQLAQTYMSKENGGRGGVVVNISSTAGLTPVFQTPVYVGSKYGVVGYTRSLAANPDVERNGMRYVCLCPGFTNTAMLIANPHQDDTPDLIKNVGINTVASVVDAFMKLVVSDDNNGGVMTVTAKLGTAYRHGLRRKNKL